jgi:hypothetical protein
MTIARVAENFLKAQKLYQFSYFFEDASTERLNASYGFPRNRETITSVSVRVIRSSIRGEERMRKALLPCCMAVLCLMSAYAQYPAASLVKDPLFAGVPVELSVLAQPIGFQGTDRKHHLVYELHISNFSSADLFLQQIEVLNDSGGIVASYSGEQLKGRLRPLPGQTATQALPGGMRAVIFLWLDFPDVFFPRTMKHRLTVTVPNFPWYGTREVEGGLVRVAGEARTIGAPLRGSEWWASNGPSNESHHRRTLIAEDGEVRFPERYATDWAKQQNGELLNGDASKNSSYFGYGAEVFAVADGTVVSILDGLPENQGDSETHAVPIDLKTIGGNNIILDIGQHQYAFYAHLQPHSIRVKVGDRVLRGQVLGRVGNSGNATGPHLHFQLSDSNSETATDGLPFVIDSVELLGRVSGEKPVLLPAPEHLQRVLPLDDDFVRFP